MEATFAAVGAMMGGSVGAGTVVMGVTVGHLFQGWSDVLERVGLAATDAGEAGQERSFQPS